MSQSSKLRQSTESYVAVGRRALLVVLCVLTLQGGWLPTEAAGDGDPASDVLVAANVFLPAWPAPSTTLRNALMSRVAQIHKNGDPLKVAIIRSQADLGAIPSLFGRSQLYAEYLDVEISLHGKQPLLVVMDDGYGTAGLTPEAIAAVRKIPLPSRDSMNALVGAAIEAVDAIAATDVNKHAIGATTPRSRNASRSTSLFTTGRDVAAIVLAMLIIGTLAALAATTLRAKRRDG